MAFFLNLFIFYIRPVSEFGLALWIDFLVAHNYSVNDLSTIYSRTSRPVIQHITAYLLYSLSFFTVNARCELP